MIVVVRSYWQDYTSPKIKSMGGFFNFSIEMKWVYWSARAGKSVPGSSIAGNWSRFSLCDIVIRSSVAFVVSTDPDVHFECCISADSKVQASVEHETEVKPIQACHVHSGALDELPSQRSTGKYSLLFFKLGHIALTFLVVIGLVVVQDSVVIKTANEHLRLSTSPSVPSICGKMYGRKLSGRWLRLICDRHNYLLLEYLESLENWSILMQPAPQNWIYSISKY